jgi:hypothetical protein
LKQAFSRKVPKEASKCVCTSIFVSSDPFRPTTSTSSGVRTPEFMEEDPDGPETAGEGDIQM